MKKFTLLKTLLVAVGLCGGMSAWAAAGDVTTLFSIDFSNPLVATGSNYATDVPNYTCTGATGTMNIHGQRISGSAYNPSMSENGTLYYVGTATAPISPNAGTKDIITFEFDIANANLTGRTAYFYIYAGETKIGAFNYSKYSSGSITENTFGFELTDINTAGNANSNWATHNHFVIIYNYATGKCTAKVTQYTNTTTEGATATHETDFDTSVAFTSFVVGSSHTQRMPQFDNLVITKTEGDYSGSKAVTLAFEDGDGNDISSLYTGQREFSPETNSTFTPSDYYPTAMYDGNYKYTYTSGGDAFTVTEDATVTLVYTKSARPSYTVTAVQSFGGKTSSIVGNVLEAADYTYYYPKFIKDGTTLYQYSSSTDPNASASYWTSTVGNVTENTSFTLTYEALDGECVYYSEGEDIEGAIAYAYSGFKEYMSNGSTGVLTEATLTSLAKGTYSVTASGIGRINDRHVYVYKESATDENQIMDLVIKNNAGTEATVVFTLSAATNIVASAGYDTGTQNGAGCDYIYIMKFDDVTATISSAGWATLYTPYALDFSGVANLEAYTATCSESTVTLTKVDNVPANTGVVLKGAEDTYSIPVIASSATDKGHLLGSASATAYNAYDGYTLYVLTKDGDNAQFSPVNDGEIAAGKAFLKISGGASATAKLRVVIEGETTGIASLEATEAVENSVMYNLAGQQVTSSYKGIVIRNGKKFIIK